MGGNFRLVAGMLTLQTAISALTLPLVLALLARHLG
jgi:predicted permease